MSDVRDVIYAEGQDAFEQGEDQAICPYPAGGDEHRLWFAGWAEAERYANRKLDDWNSYAWYVAD